MKSEKILEQVFEKAIKNGWQFPWGKWNIWSDFAPLNKVIEWSIDTGFYYSIIFSHDFARAFWDRKRRLCKRCGKDRHKSYASKVSCEMAYYIPAWRYHLQQMVIQEDPIKYLEKFLEAK